MDILYLIAGLLVGGSLGAWIIHSLQKAKYISRNDFDKLNNEFIKIDTEKNNLTQQIETLQKDLDLEKSNSTILKQELDTNKYNLSEKNAEYRSLFQNFSEQKETLGKYLLEIENLNSQNQESFAKISELKAINESLKNLLETQKEEIVKIQEASKIQFENIANKILEEKTNKFTHLNQENLKNILEPFGKNLAELKKTVHETYDKESKERFSLGEKVRELKDLNQQISEEAKKLTLALKGDSKTQGNWGEMILESILEKSGLVKNREYFLQEQLKDKNNEYLRSDSEGKKMQPDVVIKYPDNRNVIIDSKVSLTAFTNLSNDNDSETQDLILKQHLQSVKNHINQLSLKAYDDYDKSLDFVMMFIPSEPAYIAAMQADPQLWNYAYEKRILLLNPTNLITSLKLIADLWKREYQNKNAMEIAERGAKLYDKFVGFVENLEKVGKNLSQAKESYEDAYKQLSTGNDNLVRQTQKLKNLGIKNKKELPQGLIENSEDENDG